MPSLSLFYLTFAKTIFAHHRVLQRVLNDLKGIRLSRRRMIWLFSPPPFPIPSASCLSFSVCLCVAAPVELNDRRGGKEPNYTAVRKPGLIYEGTIGQPRKTKSLCDSLGPFLYATSLLYLNFYIKTHFQ
jgi:hypothetical protein